jgi:hypothetical protein
LFEDVGQLVGAIAELWCGTVASGCLP